MATLKSGLLVGLVFALTTSLIALVLVHGKLNEERSRRLKAESANQELRGALLAAVHDRPDTEWRQSSNLPDKSGSFENAGANNGSENRGNGLVQSYRGVARAPAYSDLEELQLNNSLRRQYAPLFHQLALPPGAEVQLLKLLSSRFLTSSDLMRPNHFSGHDEGPDPQKFDAEMSVLLGQEGYKTFLDFEKTLYARNRVDSLDSSLVTLGLAMSNDQRNALRKIVDEEYSAVPFMMNQSSDSLEQLRRRNSWLDDVDHRILERAATVLSLDQLGKVRSEIGIAESERRAMLETQLERQRAGVSEKIVGMPAG